MEFNWSTIAMIAIGLFALNGFFKGWWKEAITAGFLIVLVFFASNPDAAEFTIDLVNQVIAAVWGIIPNSILAIFESAQSAPPQIDPSNPATWMVILIGGLIITGVIGRSTLRNYGAGNGYDVRPIGSLLGALLGGFNGVVVIGLVKEYVSGSKLPQSEVASTSFGSVSGSSGAYIAATDLPVFSLTDSFLPWAIMLFGGVIFLLALRSRLGVSSQGGYRKIEVKQPYGYRKY
jgi:hypothetical protein